jgi:hypothetical protein
LPSNVRFKCYRNSHFSKLGILIPAPSQAAIFFDFFLTYQVGCEPDYRIPFYVYKYLDVSIKNPAKFRPS